MGSFGKNLVDKVHVSLGEAPGEELLVLVAGMLRMEEDFFRLCCGLSAASRRPEAWTKTS